MLDAIHTGEDDLVKRLRDGDEMAFSTIFKLHWQELYALAHAKLQSHEVAEEIVQEIFVSLWEKRSSLLITNLHHYLKTSVKNRCIDHIRGNLTTQKYFDYCKTYFPPTITKADVFPSELEQEIEKGIAFLPEKTRAIFKLSRLDGMPNSQIANLHKLTEKSVEYHITKSLKQLRVYLKDFFVSLVLFFSIEFF